MSFPPPPREASTLSCSSGSGTASHSSHSSSLSTSLSTSPSSPLSSPQFGSGGRSGHGGRYPGLFIIVLDYPVPGKTWLGYHHFFHPLMLGLRGLVDHFRRSTVLQEYYHVIVTGFFPPDHHPLQTKLTKILEGLKPRVRCSVKRRTSETVSLHQLIAEAIRAFAHDQTTLIVVTSARINFSLACGLEQWHQASCQLPAQAMVSAPHPLDLDLRERFEALGGAPLHLPQPFGQVREPAAPQARLHAHLRGAHHPPGNALLLNRVTLQVPMGCLCWRITRDLTAQQVLEWYSMKLGKDTVHWPIRPWHGGRDPPLVILLAVEYYHYNEETQEQLEKRMNKTSEVVKWLDDNF